MYIKLGATIRGVFGTNAFADGSATNADSLPTIVILDQGSAMGYAPTIVNKATGLYEAPLVVSTGNGFAVGHEYTCYAVVIVGGKTTRTPIEGISSFNITARDPDDLAFPATAGRSFVVDTSGNVNAIAQNPTGQIRPNTLIDNYVYDASKHPTSWRLRVFANKTACDAAVPGHSDNTDGETARYNVTATYNIDGTIATYKYDQSL